jgi:hypothetical protein
VAYTQGHLQRRLGGVTVWHTHNWLQCRPKGWLVLGFPIELL